MPSTALPEEGAAGGAGGSLRIAGIQMLVTRDIPSNEARIAAALHRAAGDEAAFLLTPEASLSGYHPGFDGDEVAAATERLAALARSLRVGLALGTCYQEADREGDWRYNQIRLYTPAGEYLGFHGKILRCSSLWHPGTGEMHDYAEGFLRTYRWNGIRFGALICNDLWATPGYTTMANPYLPLALKRMGAEFVLHAIHSGGDQGLRPFHESSTELWARALRLPIVQANAVSTEDGLVNAPSGAVDADGVRYVPVCDRGEQYFVCTIALAPRTQQ